MLKPVVIRINGRIYTFSLKEFDRTLRKFDFLANGPMEILLYPLKEE